MTSLGNVNADLVTCSFCRRPQTEVSGMVAGSDGVYICNECIDLCSQVVASGEPLGSLMPQENLMVTTHAMVRDASPQAVPATEFRHVTEIGDVFNSGSAVAVDVDRADQRSKERIVDFCSGLTYGRGLISKDSGVYLLVPKVGP